MNVFSIWDTVDFSTAHCAAWTMGNLCLWIEHYEHEWHLLPVYTDEELSPEPAFSLRNKHDKPQSAEWVHYILHGGNQIVPVPAMMDRPIVVRPDRRLVVIPGEQAKFYVSLPLSFRLTVGTAIKPAAARKLAEFNAYNLENAWFGDPVSGELCYFKSIRLFSDSTQIPVSALHAVCPIMISNESERELSFDRICLHTEFLGIYRSPVRFWTNEVSVVFKGPDQETRIHPSKQAPSMDGPMSLVTEPRQPIENWHFKKTFNFLKQFGGF